MRLSKFYSCGYNFSFYANPFFKLTIPEIILNFRLNLIFGPLKHEMHLPFVTRVYSSFLRAWT